MHNFHAAGLWLLTCLYSCTNQVFDLVSRLRLLTEVYFSSVSLISTPPPERVPIKTHLSAYSKEKVLQAIKFELDRGGQVFYVLPRIKGKFQVHLDYNLHHS